MKVTCRYSGVTYEVQNFGNTYLPQSSHPLMGNETKLDTLNAIYKIWHIGQLTKEESRILFVAYMKYSEFFIFRTTANPSPAIVEINMEPLHKLCNFRDVISNPRLNFPTFPIEAEGRNCSNIGALLEICNSRIADWRNNFKNARLREKLDNIEEKLAKDLKSVYNDPERAMTRLAHWTMIAAEVPKPLWEHWMPIFKTKGLDIFKLHTATLDELMDHLNEHLAANFSSHSALFAGEALLTIRNIYNKHHAGIGSFVGIDADELRGIDFDAMRANPFRIIEDDTETKNMMSIAQSAPEKEPNRNDYEKQFDYLRAKAQWNVKVQQYNRAVLELRAAREFEERQKKELNEDELNNIEDADWDNIDMKDI